MTPTRCGERIAAELLAARDRTTLLTTAIDEPDLVKQHSPLMSPLVWDLAHIANQEELWLLREVGGRDPLHPEIDPLYDAFEHPRAERPTLPLLAPGEARGYGHEVRGRVLDLLERAAFRDGAGRLRRVAHRQRLRLRAGRAARGAARRDDAGHPPAPGRAAGAERSPAAAPPRPTRPRCPAEVLVPGGPFTMGTSTEPWALDNERPAHEVHVPGFYLDTTPVTNAAYAAFIADGGYDDPRWWTADGWAHRQRAGLTAPLFWQWEGEWVRVVFGRKEPIIRNEPVLHVCWYEADAYARWAGRRLPTEAEWEKAARHDPAAGRSRRYPWGDQDPTPSLANLGQRHLRPAPAGSYPAGAAPSRRAAAHRRRVGVDELGLPAVPGVHGVAVQGVLGGVLRPGVQGAARRGVRGVARRHPRHVQELGLPDQAADLRWLPHGAVRAGGACVGAGPARPRRSAPDVPPSRLPGAADGAAARC